MKIIIENSFQKREIMITPPPPQGPYNVICNYSKTFHTLTHADKVSLQFPDEVGAHADKVS